MDQKTYTKANQKFKSRDAEYVKYKTIQIYKLRCYLIVL